MSKNMKFGLTRWTKSEKELSSKLKKKRLYLVKNYYDQTYIIYNKDPKIWAGAYTIKDEVMHSKNLSDIKEFLENAS